MACAGPSPASLGAPGADGRAPSSSRNAGLRPAGLGWLRGGPQRAGTCSRAGGTGWRGQPGDVWPRPPAPAVSGGAAQRRADPSTAEPLPLCRARAPRPHARPQASPRRGRRCPGRSCRRRSGAARCRGRSGRCRRPAGSRCRGAHPDSREEPSLSTAGPPVPREGRGAEATGLSAEEGGGGGFSPAWRRGVPGAALSSLTGPVGP